VSQIILDIGSGNTHKNNCEYALRMIDEVKAIDMDKHEIIFKAQLFEPGTRKPNIPLDRYTFYVMYRHCEDLGYKMTSSVFDLASLQFLLEWDIPFVKIANDPSIDWLIGEIPRKYLVYKSVGTEEEYYDCRGAETLFCVSEYPADISRYPIGPDCISDHTVGLDLWYGNKPVIWEKHLRLEDSTGLDAGPFAITPDELKEIL